MAGIGSLRVLALAAIFLLAFLVANIEAILESSEQEECPIFHGRARDCQSTPPSTFLPPDMVTMPTKGRSAEPDNGILEDILDATRVLQDTYFSAERGTWPDSIDWTGAVVGTHFSGAMNTISKGLMLLNTGAEGIEDWKLRENLIDGYFTQLAGYYFGEDAAAIKEEAYDDILWVVLGWMEAVQLVKSHTELYYQLRTQGRTAADPILANQTWHGNFWTPAFASRAKIFWELGLEGWDTKLCGGGMIWNPRLGPYKNAITNELWISASIAMYHYFPRSQHSPGDLNRQPGSPNRYGSPDGRSNGLVKENDARYLEAAVEGYKWLARSNMTDSSGLFTDGYHISGLDDPKNNNTKCDQRDEMVYTYNQGVILTGQRGLWDATGAASYLRDGHKLIQNAIKATGYDLKRDRPLEAVSDFEFGKRLPKWHGLGRVGIMEEICDASATCSQDSQTFKGIYFHHLTAFCAPLELLSTSLGLTVDVEAFNAIKAAHEDACSRYTGWLRHNVRAALGTREDGKFGGWWTPGLFTSNVTGPWPNTLTDGIDHQAAGTDYRTYGVPNQPGWRLPGKVSTEHTIDKQESNGRHEASRYPGSKPAQRPMNAVRDGTSGEPARRRGGAPSEHARPKDPNDRGRGRTVETQSGGMALLRAYWSISRSPQQAS